MNDTIVFFPKYTTLVTAASPGHAYYSDPFDVTTWNSLAVEVNFEHGTTGSTISAQMEQSSDLITWTNLGSAIAPSLGALGADVFSNPARYVRMKLSAILNGGSVTIWAKGVARST